jgi:hypothetical protein
VTLPTPPAPPVAPERRSPLRGILLGVGITLVFVIVAVIVFAVTRPEEREATYLSPTSGSPSGARGVVQVLGDQGVDVRPASTLAEVRGLVDSPSETTIAFYDTYLTLGPEQREELLRLADTLVVFEPIDSELAELAPGVVTGLTSSFLGEPLTARCEVAAAERAGTIDAGYVGFDSSEAENDVVGCFPTEDGEHVVLQTRTSGTLVTIVGSGDAFTNGSILEAGNAAFALNLLGEHDTLVWYRPGFGDLADGDIPTAANRSAPWLTPLIILTLAVGFLAAIWQGRRLGPLVAEKLPVVVRSNETMEGRARLYERAGAREHALDALRIGAVARLARACNLPRRATVDEVIDAVVAVTGRPREGVADLLVERIPTSDSHLVALSDELLLLETDVTRATRGR